MKIKKVFNNNVVLAEDDEAKEIVVMGRGLAFQKKANEEVDDSKIEKTFVLGGQGFSEKLADLLKDTPEEYLHLSDQILTYAKSHLSYKLDDYLYVALTDHLSFAISRQKQGIELKNPMQWEIRKLYKQEFEIAKHALDIIQEDTGVRLAEDEAASIALHLVNSQLSGENMEAAVQMTEMVNDILNIVKYHYRVDLDEHSINYERFLTHLRYFTLRYIRKEDIQEESGDSFLFDQVKGKYEEAFKCSEKIANYLYKVHQWNISNDEKVYLTLHIHRVTKRHQTYTK